jgi:hypothetical protein
MLYQLSYLATRWKTAIIARDLLEPQGEDWTDAAPVRQCFQRPPFFRRTNSSTVASLKPRARTWLTNPGVMP